MEDKTYGRRKLMSAFEDVNNQGTKGEVVAISIFSTLIKKGLEKVQIKLLLGDFSEFINQVFSREVSAVTLDELNQFLGQKGWSIKIEAELLELFMQFLNSSEDFKVVRHQIQ